VPLSAATRGRLLSPASSLRLSLPSRLGSSKTFAIFHQFVCDCLGLSLTVFGDATRATPLLPLRDLETVQRLVFYSQKKKKKKKKKKNCLLFVEAFL
jgi:hypothetical protein